MASVHGELDWLRGEISTLGPKIETQQELVRQARNSGGDPAILTFEMEQLDYFQEKMERMLVQLEALPLQLADTRWLDQGRNQVGAQEGPLTTAQMRELLAEFFPKPEPDLLTTLRNELAVKMRKKELDITTTGTTTEDPVSNTSRSKQGLAAAVVGGTALGIALGLPRDRLGGPGGTRHRGEGGKGNTELSACGVLRSAVDL
eukprot:CAMPEP_0119101250 /NCGR_PEP_ID=MMETSP1180-20130426/347_1 /TAXON_ID=3052 ORGANISM="Chlamydomonas cf sp, Strain CCMP681" /NCGR_SAMPLE_ID=MMETSP1180 /ASSEMBLY_ACC=CAM_ASM_000741 /LENGTH=202 /DNA_ID=CAMNT_0007085343 /DNA_START=276 /DNA_END=885 /DNA_ORIENTATION=-